MRALVIGLGMSGTSAAALLEKRGVEVHGYDDRSPLEEVDLHAFSLVVPSPGVKRDHPLLREAIRLGIEVKSEVELALEDISQPCIGVTGTNGKTTVVRMIEHVLCSKGKPAIACGNVGVPLSRSVGGSEILVIELSSYQLDKLEMPVLDVAAVTNIEEDHLDWHGSFASYASAKGCIANCVKPGGTLLLHESVPKEYFSSHSQVYSGGNEEAARLICQHFGVSDRDFFAAISSFSKPAHRLEFVAEIDGVCYYNDSKATNTASVCYALRSLQQKVILLLGGQDKGLSFASILDERQWIDQIIVFGEARDKIASALQSCQVHKVVTVEEATALAKTLANGHGTVLFSPGAASFDAFRNFEERGERFKQVVGKENK